jgi:mRNA interferase RelE/StbE
MPWTIEVGEKAAGEIRKLDPQTRQRIMRFLSDRLAPLDDPRSIGEALKGSELGSFWKYRVGDYRIVADIDDGLVRILVVRVGNRRNVSRR